MRWKAVIVLAAVLCAVLALHSLELMIRDGHLMIGSLDVCHSTTPALSTNGDMPCLNKGAYAHIPSQSIAYSRLPHSVFALFPFPQQNDRPPKPQVFVALGVNGEMRGREKEGGVTVPDSGGNTVYLSPGLQVVLAPHWVAELSYQHAIYHNLYESQLGETYKVVSGVTYLF